MKTFSRFLTENKQTATVYVLKHAAGGYYASKNKKVTDPANRANRTTSLANTEVYGSEAKANSAAKAGCGQWLGQPIEEMLVCRCELTVVEDDVKFGAPSGNDAEGECDAYVVKIGDAYSNKTRNSGTADLSGTNFYGSYRAAIAAIRSNNLQRYHPTAEFSISKCKVKVVGEQPAALPNKGFATADGVIGSNGETTPRSHIRPTR